MKREDIKEFKITDSCYGANLEINGIDYNDLSKEDVMEFIVEILEKDTNKEQAIREVFMHLLHYLDFDETHEDLGICDQCGTYCDSAKYTKE